MEKDIKIEETTSVAKNLVDVKEKNLGKEDLVKQMFEVGAQYGYSKSKRHPSTMKYIFGLKNRVEIFDLEKTVEELVKAEEFVSSLAKEGKKILFIGTKNEARNIVKENAESANQPYVINRWIGGTITNFSEIKKRVNRLIELKEKREKNEFSKYTKKEQLLIDREIKRLDEKFGGIISLEKIPDAVFVIDVKKEKIAVQEAIAGNIPIISLSSSDCNLENVNYPIPANDSSVASVKFFVNRITNVIK